jgi:hypothetical protein
LNTKRVLFIVLIVFVICVSTVQAEKHGNDKVKGCVGPTVSNFNHIFGGKMLGTGVPMVAQDQTMLKEYFDLDVNNFGQVVQAIQNGYFDSPVIITIYPDSPLEQTIEIYHTCYHEEAQ